MKLIKHLRTSLLIIVATIVGCCLVYPLIILGVGKLLTPATASGHLVYDAGGLVVGSEIIAQNFTRRNYFWPRPSAVDFNASGSGGSNLSPTNPELRKRALVIMAKYEAVLGVPIPADLVTASGSGLDPYISLEGATYQVARVAAARNIDPETLMVLLDRHSAELSLVNVLKLNLELDRLTASALNGGGK